MKKLVAIWNLLRTDTYVLVTDIRTLIRIPSWIDPKDEENMMWLLAQRSSLQYIMAELEKSLRKYDKRIQELSRRERM